MRCPRCGEANAYSAKFCLRCGAPMPVEPPPPSETPLSFAESPDLPPPKVLQPLPPPPPLGPPENSGKAVASLICGLFMWLFPAAVAAIILGHVSLSEIGRSAGRLKGRGLAITGLALGYAGIFLIPVILILLAILIPNLLRARMAANEASAVASLRGINIAAIAYANTYGNGFPPSLRSMGGVRGALPGCDHAQLIDSELAAGVRNGYTFFYLPTGAEPLSDKARAHGCSAPGSSAFELHADPVTRGATGERSFYSDQTGMIRSATSGPASSDSPLVE